MNKDNIYYLSIESTSLTHYIAKALILPSRFYTNRPSDIQNMESDYLVLSKNKFLNESNCSIALIINDEEINNIIKTKDENIFLYKKPLPISRIKKIYFTDNAQKVKTINNINRGVGFISEKLIEIVSKDYYKLDIGLLNIEKYNDNYSPEIENKIKTYNNVLGGLAFVRYDLEGKYFKNYLSILTHFNHFIESERESKRKEERYNKYDGAFTQSGDFWSNLSPYLYRRISEEDILDSAKQESIDIEKSNGLSNYRNIDDKSITYKLAILNNYGQSNKRKDINDLISDFKNEKILKEKQEGISLIFGINNGYSGLRNEYYDKIVKFKMDSLFDYYSIESVFQYVINDNKDNKRFEYIDKIGVKKEPIFDKLYETYSIMDETIITNESTIIYKIKEFLKDSLFEKLNIYIDKLFDRIRNIYQENIKLIEEMKEKDEQIHKLNKNINNQKEELEKKDKQINNLNQSLKEKDEQISEKDEQINELKEELEKRDRQINELKEELEQEKYRFEDLNKEKYKQINDLNQSLKEKDEQISEKDEQINELKEELEQEKYRFKDLNKEKDKQINNLSSTAKNAYI